MAGLYTVAKNLTGNYLYNQLGPTAGNYFDFTRESHENVNKAMDSIGNGISNFFSHPGDGLGSAVDWAKGYGSRFIDNLTTVATTDRNSQRLLAAKDATVQTVDTVLTVTGVYDGIKLASTAGSLLRAGVADLTFSWRNPGLALDNWKIADGLASRGTLVENELGAFTLRTQAETAQGTGAFKQLAAKPEVPRLTFDAATGAEIPAVGAPLRLESSVVPTAAPAPATLAESVKGPFSVAANEERVVMFDEFASHASSTGLESVFTKPVAEIYSEVYAVPKAARPPVETYIPKPAIEAHVAQFDAGASRFMTESNLAKYGPAQRDGTAFVMPKAQADKLLADAGGNAAAFEEALGLPSGTLSTNPMVRVDFPHPRDLNVRMPRGTEAGANSQWLPGGYLPNGQIEAVIDLGGAKPGAYTTTPVYTGPKATNSTVGAFQLEEFVAPSTGKNIQAAVSGNAIVPIDKVSIYARGGVADVSKELRALQDLKQNSRKVFDANPANIDRLDRLKSMQHNYERSTAMARELDKVGLANTPANNNILINHLLETGQSVGPANRVWKPSVLEGPTGALQVKSTWKILDDNRAYLQTLMFVPMK